ncbi:switch protein/serine-threonine kinase; controls the activity of the anxiosome (stressosome) [Actinacidiphila cocklensis]|uniref:Switch protein/serine-threonine kinase controls the activity of the anxiosome (Stressosome) n=2 Tax=Actinacidiphila cocklensis TaxID=887465 RepID=A0A9W4DZU9_9ACTN|nr:switch protein/serine-threonine kinase; controls the activity of the anxiosome (stressosome) [Actinacidiphila cocklensis]
MSSGVEPVEESAAEESPIVANADVVKARQMVRALAQQARLSLVDQTKLVTAASELARNTLTYGGGGSMRMSIVTRDGRTGVKVVFRDEGPGIPDLELALTDGWSSGKGMGLGLSGARRLADEFDLVSEPGKGTHVVVVKWAR